MSYKAVCQGAWAIPPSPLMRAHGNDYYTCSDCGEKCDIPTTQPPDTSGALRDAKSSKDLRAVAKLGDEGELRKQIDDKASTSYMTLLTAGTTNRLKYFEANLLDGDAVQPSQMLAATEVYEVMAEYVAQLEQRVLEAVGEDESHAKYMSRDSLVDLKEQRDWAWTIASRRNALRAELRTKLKGVFQTNTTVRATADNLYGLEGNVTPAQYDAISALRQMINEEFVHKGKQVSNQLIYNMLKEVL